MTRRYFRGAEPPIAVCPYAYNRCMLLAPETCVVTGRVAKAQDAGEYQRQADRAQGCKFLGRLLTPSQHLHRRIGKLA